jgi:hypothetical protein
VPRRTTAILTGALLVALAGCWDSTGPSPQPGYYLLTDANGQPPPVLVQRTPACDLLLSKTGFSLLADGTFSFGTLVLSDCTRSGGAITASAVTMEGTYRASDGRLTLKFASPGSPLVTGHYDATHLTATIPASPQTFPISITASFRFYPAPPP